MAELTKLDIAKIIVSERISSANCGIYNSRNIFGDPMTTVYRGNHLTIDICYPYAYFEVFGLSEKEFEELADFYEIKRNEYFKSLFEEED
jgi:hypothetical protein